MEIKATNINDAFDRAVKMFSTALPLWARTVAPRGMPTLEVVEPVITHYKLPMERVLFSPARDANPFLHFFESLWMLAGRNDVAFLEIFSKRMSEFSDNGLDFSGAYGYRWRVMYGQDQLQQVVSLLRQDPNSRRGVITMWNSNDLYKSKGLNASRDVPCNTQVYVKIRDSRLDITVTCRSNDMLWGAYGSNVVQFSMLQEYLANKLGVSVGRYTQVSDSFHVYLPPHPSGAVWERVLEKHVPGLDLYGTESVAAYPLGAGDPFWDNDMKIFFENVDSFISGRRPWAEMRFRFATSFWNEVARPMWNAWHLRHVAEMDECIALDWRRAGIEWMERHPKKETK